MKKGIIKAIVCVATFFIAIITISMIMNRGNTDTTMEMSEASFPVVYIDYQGEHINALHGYSGQMDVSTMHDTVTPLMEDRKISLYIEKYSSQIKGISYEVRSTDGERLIQNGNIYDYKDSETGITAVVAVKDLIDPDVEYEFMVKIETTAGKTIYYYTRIIERSENHAEEEIAFALDFHNKTFDKNAAKSLTTYLETDETGDNTSYSNVNIHSNFNQLTWGNLSVERQTEPKVSITEFFAQTARIRLNYLVKITTEDGEMLCRVEEYYRLRYGTQRIYLLDYERNMDQIFEMELGAFANNKLSLGIRNANVEMKESEDGGIFAFVSEDRLFCYNSSSNRFSMLFGFYGKDNEDERTYYDQSDIKILNVDETGNVEFMVYGYMNRGTHEGNMGIAVYFYNSVLSTIEEEVYVPYDKSFALLSSDISQLTYLNSNNELFLYLDSSIFCIKLQEKSYEIIAENLSQGTLKVSKSNRMVVWPKDEDANRNTSLELMSLNSKTISNISAGGGNYIKPLGFMEEDLVYGLAHTSDVTTDNAGGILTPMYVVNIRSQSDNNIRKTYEKPGIYILGVTIEGNQITMERVARSQEGDSYLPVENDQIMSTELELNGENAVEVVATENLQKIVQIAAKSEIATRSLKFLTPKEVMYEGGHEVILDFPKSENERFYVWGAAGIVDVTALASDAVREAEAISGTVINEQGEYVWVRGNRVTANQIMKISPQAMDEENSSLAVCLNTMLSVEGVTRNCQYLLEQGGTALSILEDQMPEAQILDLSGCSMDSILYYVNRDIPVLAIMKDRSAVLIIGFNELNTVIMDPATGTIYKKGMNDSTEWFNNNGNQFIAYIP